METWKLEFSSIKSKDDILNKIISGEKTIETRPRIEYGVDLSQAKPGDEIVFKSLDTDKIVKKEITSVRVYKNIEEMVKNEDVEKISPGIGNKENLLARYEELKEKWKDRGYAELIKSGMVAIHFK